MSQPVPCKGDYSHTNCMTGKGEPKRKGKREEKGHRRAQLISAENNYPFSSNNFLSPHKINF